MEGDDTVVDTTAVSVVAVAGGISAIEEAAAGTSVCWAKNVRPCPILACKKATKA